MTLGVADFLAKPVDVDPLYSALSHVLAGQKKHI